MSDNHDEGKFVAGVLLGAAIGAVAALMLAPDKGEVTRKKVHKKLSEYLDKGKDIVADKKEEAKEAVREVLK